VFFFFFQAEDGIRDLIVTGVQTCALPIFDEHKSLYARAGLPEPRLTWYRLESEMEALIARSFPNPGDDDKIRALFRASLADDALGIQTRLEDGKIHYGFPVAVLVADR